MSLGNRLNPRPEDLPQISAVAKGHGRYRRDQTGHPNDLSESVVDVEQLHQQGDAPDHFYVDRSDTVDDLDAGDTPQAGEQTDDQGEDDGQDRNDEGHHYPVGQEGDDAPVRLLGY